jgi:hypothetical protein
MKTNKLLVTVIALQSVILLGQWTGSGPATPVHAQVPDAGAQRLAMIQELKQISTKLDGLNEVLTSGKVQVHVARADDKDK